MNLAPTLGKRCDIAGSAERANDERVPVVPSARRRNAPKHVLSGYSSTRIVMEFTRWAVEREEFPTMEAIVRRFDVSRATAYRWRNTLGETYMLDSLPPNEHERFVIANARRRKPAATGAGAG
jgi:hypothetical protein